MKIRIDEKELENFLIENPEHHKLWTKDDMVIQQPRLDDAGVADIIVFRKERTSSPDNTQYEYLINIDIYELKNEKLTVDHFVQLMRYVSFLKEAIYNDGWTWHKKICDININYILIGSGDTISSDLFYILNTLDDDHFSILTYELHPSRGIKLSSFVSHHIAKDKILKLDIFEQLNNFIALPLKEEGGKINA